jgi:undecaprenyl diphosphate synthase
MMLVKGGPEVDKYLIFKYFSRFWRKKKPSKNIETEADLLLKEVDKTKLPRHIAIIMDGNGRWALRRGMPRSYGHRAGVESLRDIVRICSDLKVKILTVYAFSTENWKRPQEEVNTLMDLLVEYFDREIDELIKNRVKVNPIGRLQELPPATLEALKMGAERTRDNDGLILNVAFNYGGRQEILDTVRAVVNDVLNGKISPDGINEQTISERLYTAGQPDPDLLIRPAGDLRISNFLLWQLAYTEFWISPVMWPDFRRTDLIKAILDFQRRERRFGGLK